MPVHELREFGCTCTAQDRSEWLAKLTERGVRFRAEVLYAELEVLLALRPKAKAAMLREAQCDPAWAVLRTIPFLGPVRVALLLATLQTPWRFRTKRHLWAYPLQAWYQAMVARGMREELARVTLTRKLAAITLHVWKTGERYDPAKLTPQAR